MKKKQGNSLYWLKKKVFRVTLLQSLTEQQAENDQLTNELASARQILEKKDYEILCLCIH